MTGDVATPHFSADLPLVAAHVSMVLTKNKFHPVYLQVLVLTLSEGDTHSADLKKDWVAIVHLFLIF